MAVIDVNILAVFAAARRRRKLFAADSASFSLLLPDKHCLLYTQPVSGAFSANRISFNLLSVLRKFSIASHCDPRAAAFALPDPASGQILIANHLHALVASLTSWRCRDVNTWDGKPPFLFDIPTRASSFASKTTSARSIPEAPMLSRLLAPTLALGPPVRGSPVRIRA